MYPFKMSITLINTNNAIKALALIHRPSINNPKDEPSLCRTARATRAQILFE